MEDDVLPELYDVLANILNALDFEQVADLASRKRYNALQNVAKSRFGASIICKLLDRGQVSLSQLSIQVKILFRIFGIIQSSFEFFGINRKSFVNFLNFP